MTVNNNTYDRSLILSPQAIWPNEYLAHNAVSTEEAAFMPFISLKPQVFLFGTGETQQFLSPWLQALLYQHRIGVEAMTTSAACRTYNVLLAEGRQVIVSLLLAI